MTIWSALLMVLGVLWLAQIVGTYFQMRHYRRVLGRITEKYSEGYVGVGNSRTRFGKGVILILVVDSKGVIIREALRMKGMTVFARFKRCSALEGLDLEKIKNGGEPLRDRSTALAAQRAIEQIERISEERGRQLVSGQAKKIDTYET